MANGNLDQEEELLRLERSFEDRTRRVSELSLPEPTHRVELFMRRTELQSVGEELAREWPWVCLRLAEDPVACQALLQLGVERWCELHRQLPLCTPELDCQPLHAAELSDLTH